MTHFRIAALLASFLFVLTPRLPAQGQTSPFFEGTLSFEVEMKGPMAKELAMNEPNNEMTMHLKDGNYIVLLSGGRYPKTFLFVADSNYEYSIDAAKKVAYRYSMHADLNRKNRKADVRATPTGRQEEIAGYPCQEYTMLKDDTRFFYFVNDDIRVNLEKFEGKFRAQASFLVDGLDGRIPLKTIRKEENLVVETTCTKVVPREFDQQQFLVPPSFKVKGRDRRF